jgi:hypothetical protein
LQCKMHCMARGFRTYRWKTRRAFKICPRA